jgi:CubicO group peptidase (beta-lactamase class C family)
MASDNLIHGSCTDAYQGVRDAFANNFESGDLGASCAVTVDGELVVDLWGGHSDLARTKEWQRDTIVNVWSTTKMVTALCTLMLHDRGVISIDEPMATYWPEFAAAGKEGVLVRHVLGHTAGLSLFRDEVDELTVFDWDECCRRLAAQAPLWTPGDGSGYHAETQGWLLGELIRRTDGRTVGTFFREEVAEPRDIDFHLGVPDRHHDRIAEIATYHSIPIISQAPELQVNGRSNAGRSASLANTGSWRRAELPASNGHGNARSVALAMAPLANGGDSLISPKTIERCFEVQSDQIDRMLGRKMRLGIGFGLNSEESPLGVNDRTLWWAGWGGSMCVIDVENNMTVSYTMNRMMGEGDFRAAMVIFAAHGALAAT